MRCFKYSSIFTLVFFYQMFTYAKEPITIMQLFHWRWADIAQECSYLGRIGVSAVTIDPVAESADYPANPWWDTYQPVSFKFNNRYGSERDFQDLIRQCHQANVLVYVGFIARHVATFRSDLPNIGKNGTKYERSKYYLLDSPPTNYNYEHKSHKMATKLSRENSYFVYKYIPGYLGNCGLDPELDFAGNRWKLVNCDLAGLPTLKLDNPDVLQIIRAQVNRLLQYGVDGFFLDASRHLQPNEIRKILDGMQTKTKEKPFLYLELPVIGNEDDDREAISYKEYTSLGRITGHNFATLMMVMFSQSTNPNYNSQDYLLNNPLQGLPPRPLNKNHDYISALVKDDLSVFLAGLKSDQIVTMVENHDTDNHDMPTDPYMFNAIRLINAFSVGNTHAYILANVFMLSIPYGLPVLYSGYLHDQTEFNPFPIKGIYENMKNKCFTNDVSYTCLQRWNYIKQMTLFRKQMNDYKNLCHQNLNFNQIGFGRCDKGGKTHGYVIMNNTNEKMNKNMNLGLSPGCYEDILHTNNKICVNKNGQSLIKLGAFDAIAIM